MKKFDDIEEHVSALEKQGGVTADERMKLVDDITEIGDSITSLFTRLSEVPDAEPLPDEAGVMLEPPPDLTPEQMKALKNKYKIAHLRKLGKTHGISKYKTSTAATLIAVLHAKGVEL